MHFIFMHSNNVQIYKSLEKNFESTEFQDYMKDSFEIENIFFCLLPFYEGNNLYASL